MSKWIVIFILSRRLCPTYISRENNEQDGRKQKYSGDFSKWGEKLLFATNTQWVEKNCEGSSKWVFIQTLKCSRDINLQFQSSNNKNSFVKMEVDENIDKNTPP